jgi:diguanylate cyclase (GGDEF)-like protein
MTELEVTQISRIEEEVGRGESCLVQIHGVGLGRKYSVIAEGEMTIGRDAKNGIVLDLDNVSRRHASIATRGNRSFVKDLGSTNGTYLNGKELLEETPLRSGDNIKIGGCIFKFLSGSDIESQYYEAIYQLTIVDGLTQVHNKRYLLEFLEREMGRCQRYQRALSLIMFDLDRFKKVNDKHGHPAGDSVLREVAARVKQWIRMEECFARFGGEEFAIVVPESGPENTRRFAEKVRRLIEEKPIEFEAKQIPVTISLGVADLAPDMMEPMDFLKVADANLYKAKKAGRNQVVG